MKNLLVSGGSRGIGAAIVSKAYKEYNCIYLYKNEALLDLPGVTAVKCDVSDPDDCRRAVKQINERFGDIDCLVNNSGISLTGLATDFSFKDYRKVMDTNFGGLFNLTSLLIPSMVRNMSGNIIAISSMWGQTGSSCEALYSASKGAVDSYVRSLAKELGPSGIRVNAVSPGVIRTDMMKEYSEEDIEQLKDETPLERIGTPEDIADTVMFLLSERSSFITGQIIGVNGGFLI